MEQINNRLNDLMEKMARQHKLKAMTEDLKRQCDLLSEDVKALKKETYYQELDVEKLEKFSLPQLYYRLTGRLDEMLEKEESEACAAAMKYDAKRRELERMQEELRQHQQELRGISGYQREYESLLQQKGQRLKEMNTYYADRICALEESLAYQRANERELQEAIQAANSALQAVDSVQSSLSSAENWSTFDLLGGGVIGDIAKHSLLDNTQNQISSLQRSLSRLRTELADVAIRSDLQIQVDGFLRFADYFFDGLFADWAVRDKIQNSRRQVDDVERSVRHILTQLNSRLSQCRSDLERKQKELDDLVLKA